MSVYLLKRTRKGSSAGVCPGGWLGRVESTTDCQAGWGSHGALDWCCSTPSLPFLSSRENYQFPLWLLAPRLRGVKRRSAGKAGVNEVDISDHTACPSECWGSSLLLSKSLLHHLWHVPCRNKQPHRSLPGKEELPSCSSWSRKPLLVRAWTSGASPAAIASDYEESQAWFSNCTITCLKNSWTWLDWRQAWKQISTVMLNQCCISVQKLLWLSKNPIYLFLSWDSWFMMHASSWS